MTTTISVKIGTTIREFIEVNRIAHTQELIIVPAKGRTYRVTESQADGVWCDGWAAFIKHDAYRVLEAVEQAVQGVSIDNIEGERDVMKNAENEIITAQTHLIAVIDHIGLEAEEIDEALVELFSRGLTGADAGVSLRVALLNLSSPTAAQRHLAEQLDLRFFTEDGRFMPLKDICEMLRRKLASYSPTSKATWLFALVGSAGFRSIWALINSNYGEAA